ncbi:MAG: S41 family peptidase [Acidobacteriota bacterium]
MNRRFHYAVVASSTCIVGLLLFGTVAVSSAAPDDSPYTQLGVFSDVLSKIKNDYVEEPDIKAVTNGAVNGLLESLDPFASYLTAEQYKQYQTEHGKGKADVGLFLSRGPGYLRIVDALPGSASDQAGLTTGDVIESINKISTRDMPLASAELLLQGEPGSTVEISALTPRQSDPQTIKMTRAALKYPAVTAQLVTNKGPDAVGVITVGALLEGRSKEIAQKVTELEKQGAKKFMLDLRYVAAGPVEEGVALADVFMDSGLIGYTQGQKVRRADSTAKTSDTATKLPLVVLTNRGTAGAAEVAAAALQDSKRAQLVGEPTFGNAAVRKAITLADGSAVIIAVAKYYTPNGKAIQDSKVTPGVLQAQFEAPVVSEEEGAAADPAKVQKALQPDLISSRAFEQIQKGLGVK